MVEREVRPAIATFRGDWAQLARMMQQSWGTNKEQPLRYTDDFLRSALSYPGCSIDLAPAVYSGDHLVAFVAGFPRTARLCGRSVRLLLNSFLTASVEVRGLGYGLMVWRALIDRARAAGYEGTINFCVEGDEMNAMMPALARLFHLNTRRIYAVEYLNRFVRPAPVKKHTPVSSAEIENFCKLAEAIPDSVPLARTWTYPEAEWQCRRPGAIAVSLLERDRRGMLTGYVAEAGTQPVRVAIMEDLFWGNLNNAERAALLQRFLEAAAAYGCQNVSCPVLGYSSTETLTAAGFRASRRTLHTYLTLWNGEDPVPLPSIYVDVF
jgi:GNAT superfamily N-acetyltransferase